MMYLGHVVCPYLLNSKVMKARNRWAAIVMISMAILSIVMTGCEDDDEPIARVNYTISGSAAGGQVVPPATGTGTGTITGTYNPTTRVLTYTNTWTTLSGAPTGGGFYYGPSGSIGASVGTPWTYGASTTATGSYSGTLTLTETEEEQLIAGDWYYGYNTVAYPDGEIRGQITSTPVK